MTGFPDSIISATEAGTKKQVAARLAIAVLIVAVTTLALWLLRDRLTIANMSLIYILATLITAVWLGTIPSLVVAFLSVFGFNFFLIRPYYTLDVADTREILDLFIFLAVAIISGRLAGYARQQAETVRQNAAEQQALLRLSTALNPLTDRKAIIEELERAVVEEVGAIRAEILPGTNQPEHSPNKMDFIHYVLIETGDNIYGTIKAEFTHPLTAPKLRLLSACTVQAAVALQRIELTEQAQHSRSLAEADKLKTALLQAVSHDLRTPITIIKTSAAHLDNLIDQLSIEQQHELARSIEFQADSLNELVSNLLDMSRLQAGAMVLNCDWNSLEEIAGEAAARAFQVHQAEKIRLEFPDDMPLVWCDYGLILRALENIVENALRYEPSEFKVIIRAVIHQNQMGLDIINHGSIIPEAEKAMVVQPFYQGDQSRSVVGSVGLGLAIARGIVEVHRGQLIISDTIGGGVTFSILLPTQGVTP